MSVNPSPSGGYPWQEGDIKPKKNMFMDPLKIDFQCLTPLSKSSPGPAISPSSPVSPRPLVCICDRHVKMVLCRSCGMTLKGRVRQRCKLHPNNIHLMDLDVCPNCKASHLMEFAETATAADSEDRNN